MSNLIKKSIVDKNGVATHRWSKPEGAEHSFTRVSTLNPPIAKKINLLGGLPIPEISFNHLYHVGMLDPNQKKSFSLEGSGLSVSRNPSAWRAIARLQGDTYHFDVKDNRFLDWHELHTSQKEAITDWGLKKGYLEKKQLYKVEYWDDELDSEQYIIFENQEDANSEAEGMEGTATPYIDYVASESFPDKKFIGDSTDYEQVLAAIWVNEETTDFDGVWWEDTLNVSRYSAPRGVLAGTKIEEWIASASVVHDDEIIEDEENDEEYYDEEDD